MGPLMMTGQSDAITAWLTDVSRYQGQAAEVGKEWVVLLWSDAGLELYSAALMPGDAFLSERPDVAKRFVAAFSKSIELAYANPDRAGAAVSTRVSELSAEDVQGTWLDASKLVFNEMTDQFDLGAIDDDHLAADHLAADRIATTWICRDIDLPPHRRTSPHRRV
jgi:NitT/TauT family transport system substrate-binding protein